MATKKQYFDEEGKLLIKPYRLKDLCAIYDMNYQTLNRWIKRHPQELSKRNGNYYSVDQVEFFIKQYGLPRKIIARVVV